MLELFRVKTACPTAGWPPNFKPWMVTPAPRRPVRSTNTLTEVRHAGSQAIAIQQCRVKPRGGGTFPDAYDAASMDDGRR